MGVDTLSVSRHAAIRFGQRVGGGGMRAVLESLGRSRPVPEWVRRACVRFSRPQGNRNATGCVDLATYLMDERTGAVFVVRVHVVVTVYSLSEVLEVKGVARG